MSFTYDLSTDRGRVRLLISDTDTVNADRQFFTDDEIDAFLAMASGGSVKRAAAVALDTIASNQLMVDKKIRTQDLQTDAPAVAEALRRQAKALRDEADRDEDDDADDGGLVVVTFNPNAAWQTSSPTYWSG